MEYYYDAFISYRHLKLDLKVAEKLHKGLETFKLPQKLVKKGFPKRINRVFRDREELPTTSSLSDSISDALLKSKYLIVICSENTPKSDWVTKEVEIFISLGRSENIILLLIDGDENISFSEPVKRIDKKVIDVRNKKKKFSAKAFMTAKLQLIASILNCDYSELKYQYQERILGKGILSGITIILFLSTFTLYSLNQWKQAVNAEKTLEVKKNITMSGIEELTYELPSTIGNIPGTNSITLKILNENISSIDNIIDKGVDRKKLLSSKATNYELVGGKLELLGDLEGGRKYYDKARAIRLELGDNLGIIVDDYNGGFILYIQGNYDKARAKYEEAVKIGEESLQKKDDHQISYHLACCYQRYGDLELVDSVDKAEEYYKKSMNIFEELSKTENGVLLKRELSVIYNKMGDVAFKRNDLSLAKDYYEKSLNIRIEILKDNSNIETIGYDTMGGQNPVRDMMISYTNLGNVLYAMGDIKGAKEDYEKSIEYAKKMISGNDSTSAQKDLSYSYVDLFSILMTEGDKQAAEANSKETIGMMKNITEKDKTDLAAEYLLAEADAQMSIARLSQGDTMQGEAYYKLAADICKELYDKNYIDKSELAGAYNDLAVAEIYNHSFSNALTHAKAAVELQPDAAYLEITLANTYLFANKYDEAKNIYLSIKDKEVPYEVTTKFKNYTINNSHKAKSIILEEFEGFKEMGVNHPDIPKIIKLLN